MTPQLQLSLKVLQLSTLELNDFISAEVQKNPLLEFEENYEKPANVEENDNHSENYDDGNPAESYDSYDSISSDKMGQTSEVLDSSDDSWSASESGGYEADEPYMPDFSYSDNDDAGTIIEKTLSENVTLRSHLLDQVHLNFESPIEKIIATNLVDMLDSNGYLSQENLDEELLQLGRQLGCEVSLIYKVLDRLKTFDPAGIFARNLKESLKLQLQELDRLDDTISLYIDNLELAAKGEISKLKKICNCDEAELAEIIKEIKTLNPRITSTFTHENVEVRVIDVFVRHEFDKSGERKWIIELNNDALPKVLLNKTYYKEVKKKTKDEDQKKYLSENYNSANWLLRSLNQRAETTLKVSTQLVEEQMEFFDKGINFLKPLKMKDIAEKLGIHESTVGRVVNGKFMSTPRGVFELKYFFTSSVTGNASNNDDDTISSLTVKNQIKELIEAEDPSEILSDESIAEILQKKGINVARRTVAKYREAIGIPTSADRKRTARLNKKVK